MASFASAGSASRRWSQHHQFHQHLAPRRSDLSVSCPGRAPAWYARSHPAR